MLDLDRHETRRAEQQPVDLAAVLRAEAVTESAVKAVALEDGATDQPDRAAA